MLVRSYYLHLAALDLGESADIQDRCLATLVFEHHGAFGGSGDAMAGGIAQRQVRVAHQQHVRQPNRQRLHQLHSYQKRGLPQNLPRQNVRLQHKTQIAIQSAPDENFFF